MHVGLRHILTILIIESIIISTLGQLSVDQETLDQIFNQNQEILVSSTTGQTTLTRDDGEDCVCVPYNLCDPDGDKIYQDGSLDGFGKLDIRFKQECSESVEVCCQKPRDPDDPVIPNTSKPRKSGCGVRNDLGVLFQTIGGGVSDTQFGEFPWTVAILNAADSSAICAGSLIHSQVVLTGAHCVKKFNQRLFEIKVRAGEWDTQTTKEGLPFQERSVIKMVTHPSFNDKTLSFDVALLFLKEPLNLDQHIATICLPKQDENMESKKNCYVTGWGKTRFGKAGVYSVIMKKVELDMVNQKLCETQFKRTRLGPRFKLHHTFTCAGGKEGVDACQGDGGAPLMCPGKDERYFQAGIVAWGIGCGTKDVPGAYGRVSSFRNWIDDEMKKSGYSTESYTAL